MTEPIAATPGWVDTRLDEVFAPMPATAEIAAARRAYADCLAARKAPAAPSDMLGAEFAPCRPPLIQVLRTSGIDNAAFARIESGLASLEAEIAGGS